MKKEEKRGEKRVKECRSRNYISGADGEKTPPA
jgi:hypothetical protein